MKSSITDALASRAHPKPKAYEIRDQKTAGFLLRIQPTGRKAYYCEYKRGGRLRIGDASVWTVKEARDRANVILVEFQKTGSVEALKIHKQKHLTYFEFLEHHYFPWVDANHKSALKTRRRLMNDCKVFHKIKLDAISPQRVEKWRTERVAKGNSPHTANRCFAYLRASLSKAVECVRRHIICPKFRPGLRETLLISLVDIKFHSFCALGTDWNEDAGRLEIRKLGSIKDVNDPEILAHYLNLIRGELSLDENLRLIEKIRSKSRLLNTQIHQGAVKANLLLCHDDFKGASNTLAEVIESVEDEENDLNIYQRDKYAQCLYLLATLGIDSKIEANTIIAEGFLRRSEEQHKILIKDGWGSNKFLAQLHRGLADCLRVRDQWEEAVTEYQKAYELDGKEIHRVFEAECLYEDECITEALNVIDAINFDGLDDDGCKIDYIVRYSRMSINEGNLERLDIAKNLLTTPLILAPHFKRQQQNALIQIMEAIEKVRKNLPKSRKKFSLGLSKFSSYFILQPNFLGVGLNVNKIIDDGVKKPNEHNLLDDEKKRT